MCMYNTDIRADQTQPENQLPLQPIIAASPATPAVTMTENVDWRTNLHPHTRQKIVNKMMENLQSHLPSREQKRSAELKKIAERFEDKFYTGATSQLDYLSKISRKLLAIKNKSEPVPGNAPQPNAGTINQDPADSGSGGIQAQVHNQAQQLPMPITGNQFQEHQQLLPQSIQNNMGSTVMHNSASLTTAPPSAVGMSPASIPNVSGQNSNLQSMQNFPVVAQQLPMPITGNQFQLRQQVFPQSIQNNVESPVMQNSASLTTAPPSAVGMSPDSIPNVSGQNSNLQSMQNIPIVAQQLPMPMTGNQFQLRQQVFPQSIQNNMESPVMQNSASLTTAPPSAVGMSPASIPNVTGQNSNLQSMQNIPIVAQQLPMPITGNKFQLRQQVFPQSIQNNMESPVMQNSASLTTAPPSAVGMSPASIPNVTGQNSNLQSMQNIPIVAQQLPMPITGNQFQLRQQVFPQSIQNNMESPVMQNSASLTTAPPSAVGMSPASIPTVSGQNSNLQSMQNISNVAQNSMENFKVQGMPSNMLVNTQPHMLGRQQQVVSQQSHQQSQNPQHYLHQPMQQHHLLSQQQNLLRIHQQQISKQKQDYLLGLQSNNSGMPSNLQNLHTYQQSIVSAQQPLQQSASFIPTQGQQSQQMQLPQQQLMSQMQLPQQQLMSQMQSQIAQLQQQKQHHLIGLQSNNSGMPSNLQNLHTYQQSIVSAQQPLQQSASFIPTQGQQSQQMQLPQQQLMSQMQSQIAQLQQQIVSLQQGANTLQRYTHLRLQTSSPLLHQNVVDLPKQMSQLQMQIPDGPSSSLNSTAQIGSVHGGDWQEDVYQKIRSMKEMYFADLNELYQRIETKIQLLGIPQQPKNEHLEQLKIFKAMFEKLLQFLSLNKIDIQIAHKEKIGLYEKQIASIVKSNKPRNPVSSLPQGQLPQSRMHVFQQNPQSQPQISQMQLHESQMSSQMKSSMDVHSVVPVQQNNLSNPQDNPFSNPQQNMEVALGSMQQNPVTGTQQIVSNLNSLQQDSNTIQQLMQQQGQVRQQLLHGHTMFQLQQQQLSQQQQQLLQQQQLFLQQKQLFHRQLHEHQQRQHQTKQQQQSAQSPSHNMFVDQMLQELGTKPGTIQQHHPAGQFSYHQPQLKSGTSLISSPSHHVTQHLSPQIDQQNMPTSEQKARTLLQYLSSPLSVPSPSTPLAPSSMLAETEKINTDVLPLADAGAVGIYLFMYLLGLLGFINLLELLGSVDQLDL